MPRGGWCAVPAFTRAGRADAGAGDRRERVDLRGRAARGAEPAAVSGLRSADRVWTMAPTPQCAVGIRHHAGPLLPLLGSRAHARGRRALPDRADLTLTGDGEPERIRAVRATPSLASVLRVSPALGRWFTAEEGAPGAPQVAVLSHGLWMRRYGGDPRHPRPVGDARRRADGGHRRHAAVVRVPRSARRCLDGRAGLARRWASDCGATAGSRGCATARRSRTRAPSWTR